MADNSTALWLWWGLGVVDVLPSMWLLPLSASGTANSAKSPQAIWFT